MAVSQAHILSLIKSSLKGDEVASKSLYEAMADRLYYTIYRYTSHDENTQDLLQETFIRIFKNLHKYNNEVASFNTWCSTIAIRLTINFLKKNTLTFAILDEKLPPIDNGLSGLDQLSADDIIKYITNLPSQQRMVFNLYEVDGYSHVEIADILGIPVGTSRSYLTRAKKNLRKKLLFTKVAE